MSWNVVIGEALPQILRAMGCPIDYRVPCPVHGGDNHSACSINGNEGDYPNSWYCFSHKCHEIFGRGLFGLVQGYLSRINYDWKIDGDNQATPREVVLWIKEHIEVNKDDLLRKESNFPRKSNWTGYRFSRSMLSQWLQIPSRFYVGRRYSEKILHEYSIGDCFQYGSFYKKAVIPIFDVRNVAVAFTARNLCRECNVCGMYHEGRCPDRFYPNHNKWYHQNIRKSKMLYNFHESLDYVRSTKTAILVESPGNALRLQDAGIPGGIATFGAELCEGQCELLMREGVTRFIVCYDADKAGIEGARKISEKYNSDIQIIIPSLKLPPQKDLGEYSNKTVFTNMRKVLQRYGL